MKKYKLMDVLTTVRCMSDGGYWFTVLVDGFGRVDYQPGFGFVRGRLPNYVHNAVRQRIGEGIRDGQFDVYECDRDGNERRSNLRYHDPQYWSDLGVRLLTGVWPERKPSLDDPLHKWQITEQGLEHVFDNVTACVYERADGLFTGSIVNAEHEYALSPETVGAWSTPEQAADALRRMWRKGN